MGWKQEMFYVRETNDGKFEAFEYGDWLGTFDTRAEAEQEIAERKQLKAIQGARE